MGKMKVERKSKLNKLTQRKPFLWYHSGFFPNFPYNIDAYFKCKKFSKMLKTWFWRQTTWDQVHSVPEQPCEPNKLLHCTEPWFSHLWHVDSKSYQMITISPQIYFQCIFTKYNNKLSAILTAQHYFSPYIISKQFPCCQGFISITSSTCKNSVQWMYHVPILLFPVSPFCNKAVMNIIMLMVFLQILDDSFTCEELPYRGALTP